MGNIYDMVIIGGGPGGYTAALYAARAGLRTVVVEKLSAGGQMAMSHQIDNYPGFPHGVDGFELAERMEQQAQRFGAEVLYGQVLRVDLKAQPKEVHTDEGVVFGKTVVIATGAGPKELGLAGERALMGRGVAYCADCEGMFYKGKTVAVIGGGNSAVGDALMLSRLAEKVILIHRRDSLRATRVYHDALKNAGNIQLQWNSQVRELVQKDGRLAGLVLEDVQTGQMGEISCDGVFISIGRKPETALVQGQLMLDEQGYIAADESTATNIPGVYAVGDVRSKKLRQIVTAVADGAVAAHMAESYLAGQL